jgi:hypothetical protein
MLYTVTAVEATKPAQEAYVAVAALASQQLHQVYLQLQL